MPNLPSQHHADQQQLRLILAALQDGVILIEPDQSLSWANRSALRMHGVSSITDLGTTVSEYRTRFELRYRNRHQVPEGGYPMERFCQLSRQRCCHTPAAAVSLPCCEDGEHGCRVTEIKHATAAGGNMLVVTDVRTEVAAEFIVAATEPLG